MMVVHALVLGAIAIYMNYRYIMVSPVIILVTLVLASTGLEAIHNEVLGPYVIRDQGQSYIYVAYSEFLLVFFANIIGINFGVIRRKNKKRPETEEDEPLMSPTP